MSTSIKLAKALNVSLKTLAQSIGQDIAMNTVNPIESDPIDT
jgi:hypothetical protein